MLLEVLERHEPGDQVKITTMREEEISNYEVVLAAPE